MKTQAIQIDSIHTGQPQTHHDAQGEWRSSIFRRRVSGPIQLGRDGLAGDEVTDKQHHGWPNMAVCCHTLDDFRFWKDKLNLDLQPGGVGENWTLAHAREDAVCLMDIYAVGTARVQVSKPRTPCRKQARRVGRSDWVRLVLQELRTGFYLQVLTPGVVQAGDAWQLQERPYPGITLRDLNRCVHQTFDPDLAAAASQIPNFDAFWLRQLAKAGLSRPA